MPSTKELALPCKRQSTNSFAANEPEQKSLKLLKTYSANLAAYHPLSLNAYENRLTYNSPPIVNLNENSIYERMVGSQIALSSGSVPHHLQYQAYEREAYSPDVGRRSNLEIPEFRRFSLHNDKFQDYQSSDYSPFQASQPLYTFPVAQGIQEIKLNLGGDGSYEDEGELKSAKDFDD